MTIRGDSMDIMRGATRFTDVGTRLLRLLQRVSLLTALGISASTATAQQTPVIRLRNVDKPDERLTVTLRLIRSVGSLEGERDAFGNIWDADLDSRGRIYVADYGQAQVTVFDNNGRYLRTIGRRGSGPGEFQNPMQIAVGPGDTLLVFDIGLRRLSKFAPDGAYVGQEVLEHISAANDIEFLPNGDVAVVGFTPMVEAVVHVFDRNLKLRRSFADASSLDVQYFSESLLGGYTDLTPSGLILYSQKSPFELRLYKADGSLLWRCTGLEGETTPPTAVVTVVGDRRSLDWKRFIHSTGVFALSDSLFLNIITDPGRDKRRLDVIDRNCRLRATSILDVPFSLLTSRKMGTDLVFTGIRSIKFPEVVVYSLTLK